jgi:hypothetical protein
LLVAQGPLQKWGGLFRVDATVQTAYASRMGLSVCIIAGNVANYIERCISSVKPFADEIIVVRAIGNQAPDSTLMMAKEMGCITGEYHNRRNDWPHVDDFAAARQTAFDMASNDYAMWIDTDDVFEGDADEVRQFVREGRLACLMMPYHVTGRGVSPMRERVLLRSAGRWHYPVHECFKLKVPGGLVGEAKRCRIVHLADPHAKKQEGRNLRILESIPPDEMNAGLRFHLFSEYQMAGRGEDALRVAGEFLDDPTAGAPEKYEVLLNIATGAPHERRRELYAQAYHTDPTRREALMLLAGNALERRNETEALAYSRAAVALPMPSPAPWNLRRSFYGWIGRDTYCACLTAAGLESGAREIRAAHLQKNPPVIALLHATRGRPEKALLARKTWLDFAVEPELIEHIFAVDADDKSSSFLTLYNHVKQPPGGGCVAAWNRAFSDTRAPIVVQMSDDFTPPMQWDRLILEEFQKAGGLDKPLVLQVSDGHRKDGLMTMAIATRQYVNQDGFLFHPDFRGMYSDNWFCELAQKRGSVIDARERLTFDHDHPAFTGKPLDETYARQNAPEEYAHGLAVIKRLREGKDWSSVDGWFDYWPFYKSVAESLPDGARIAEVGVYKGRSVIFMAQMLMRLGKTSCRIYAVDHFKDASLEDFGDALRRCEICGKDYWEMVSPIKGDSSESAGGFNDASLDFIWIDAAHDYESVKRDIRAWLPKLKPGGLMAGHDADSPDVARAVAETIEAKVFGNIWIKK